MDFTEGEIPYDEYVFKTEDGWYFFEEYQEYPIGPFKTEAEADVALAIYSYRLAMQVHTTH